MSKVRCSAVGCLVTASLIAAFAGCKSKDTNNPTGFVAVDASRTAVIANGINTVTLTVTDTGGGPVTVSTTRGTFPGGVTSATVTGASGNLTLQTCDATVDSACAGNAVVRATHGSSFDSVTITFGALATICAGDCTADAGCAALSCAVTGGGTGTCSSTTPSVCTAAAACTPVPAGATTEASCNDGNDDDCDGDIDCADSSCSDQPCLVGSPTFLCKSGACTDTTTGLALVVTPAHTRLPANGTATTTVAALVTSAGAPVPGFAVGLTTDLGTLSSASQTTGADGVASFTLTAPANAGVIHLTGTLTSVPTIVGHATVTVPSLGTLQIPEKNPVQFRVQGVKGSGWQEAGYVAVQVLDDAGQPYPDGLPVRFEHRTLGGSTLGAPLTANTASCVAPGCVGFLGATTSNTDPPDTQGMATAQLYSGTVAGTLVTVATVTAGGVTRTIELPTVAVVGARASGTNFSVVCSPRNVPALAETDCAISLVDAPFDCEAILKDRYNNVLGRATQVVFASETAAVGQITETPAYDPTAGAQDGLGIATQRFETLGAGLPFDVAPLGGETSFLHGQDGCGIRTHNPRDGLVTVVAIADGEEAFFDSNGNGAYDLGEPFVDEGEPFVDQDDSGAWEPGEWFLDMDGNGTRTARNGVWDAATKLWTQTVVVYTGSPATGTSGPNLLGTRWAGPGFTDACVATPVAPNFAVLAAKTGPPAVAPTSQTYFVVASDLNLNRLDTGTAYTAEVVAGTAVAEYQGLAAYADGLGLSYRYWPCDQTGTCASQCRATGAAAPCVMTPAVGTFGCGLAASVLVIGGSAPDPGLNRIDWDVSTPYSVFGSARTSLATRVLSGTNN